MAVVAFDTFTIAQAFEKVGFPKDHAKVVIEALVSSRSDPDTVSKAELQAKTEKIGAKIEKYESTVLQAIADLRKDTQHAISDLRKDMESKLEKLSLQLTVRLGAIMIATLSGFKLLSNFFGK